MSVTLALTGRWMVEYWRRPLNVVLLVAVPVVFVTLAAGALGDFADILGGASNVGDVEAATATWAAAVLAGVAGFFHVSHSREPDRRLARAGAGAGAVAASRLVSTLALATVASAAALAALAVRTDVAGTWRVIGATALSAAIYAGFGVLVGALVRSELNGSLIVVFAWIFDVFFGPAMGGTAPVLRLFPLHYPTLVETGVESGHGDYQPCTTSYRCRAQRSESPAPPDAVDVDPHPRAASRVHLDLDRCHAEQPNTRRTSGERSTWAHDSSDVRSTRSNHGPHHDRVLGLSCGTVRHLGLRPGGPTTLLDQLPAGGDPGRADGSHRSGGLGGDRSRDRRHRSEF